MAFPKIIILYAKWSDSFQIPDFGDLKDEDIIYEYE